MRETEAYSEKLENMSLEEAALCFERLENQVKNLSLAKLLSPSGGPLLSKIKSMIGLCWDHARSKNETSRREWKNLALGFGELGEKFFVAGVRDTVIFIAENFSPRRLIKYLITGVDPLTTSETEQPSD